ncbi:MAG: class I SAM-dependent methyltransferase, partial [Dehalococcoidia bacterium]
DTHSPMQDPYTRHAQRFFEQYQRLRFEAVHSAWLTHLPPAGFALDVGAGSGFTAVRLCSPARQVVALEPEPGMIVPEIPLPWVRGLAQDLPFGSNTFHAAYATWAFFMAGVPGTDQGLEELKRVVKGGGKIIIVDNAGGDEFSSLSTRSTTSDPDWWRYRGFEQALIHTSFRFDSLEEANRLLSFYFGDEAASRNRKTEIGYRVAAYSTTVQKP